MVGAVAAGVGLDNRKPRREEHRDGHRDLGILINQRNDREIRARLVLTLRMVALGRHAVGGWRDEPSSASVRRCVHVGSGHRIPLGRGSCVGHGRTRAVTASAPVSTPTTTATEAAAPRTAVGSLVNADLASIEPERGMKISPLPSLRELERKKARKQRERKRKKKRWRWQSVLNVVHGGDGLLGVLFLEITHKSEAAATASVTVLDNHLGGIWSVPSSRILCPSRNESYFIPSFSLLVLEIASAVRISLTASSMAPNSSNFCRSVASSVCHARPLDIFRSIQAASMPKRLGTRGRTYPMKSFAIFPAFFFLCVGKNESFSQATYFRRG